MARLESLRRIVAVQKQMVRLAESRLADAEKVCHEIKADQTRLYEYVVDESALGALLAKAALKSFHVLDRRLREAEVVRDKDRARLLASKRRERAATDLTDKVARQTERIESDRELTATVEAWLAARTLAGRMDPSGR